MKGKNDKKYIKGPGTRTASAPTSKPKPKPSAPLTAKERRKQLIKDGRVNRSPDIPVGRSFQTRDEYLDGGKPKEGTVPKSYNRKVYAVDTNTKGEMAVSKATTSEMRGIDVVEKSGNKEKVRPFIHTKDDEGNPIKPGKKFVQNSPIHDISEADAENIVETSIRNPQDYRRYTALKKRKK